MPLKNRQLRGHVSANPKQKMAPQPGFALVIALSLMGFMFLLIMGLTTMTQIELATVSHSTNQEKARRNAYLGLMVAMGELQRVAGPDARVTARADILTGDDGFPSDDMQNPYYLGIWDSQDDDWDTLSAVEKSARAVWIVSGNENLDPSDSDYITPLTTVGEDWVELAPEAQDYNVEAVRVKKSSVGDSGVVRGDYAYWVTGDNSKALVSVKDPNADSSDVDALNRSFQVPQRTAVEAVDGLENFPVNDDALLMIFDQSIRESDWVSSTVSDVDTLRQARLHDLTTYSKGLLVDVKDGALKRDLTKSFELRDVFAATFSEDVNGDAEAADPTTAEPYYFIQNSAILSGGPNWGILQDYYQHYRPSSNNKGSDETLHLRAEEISAEGSSVYKFMPRRASSLYQPTSPYDSSLLPYESEYDDSSPKKGYDLYQDTSWGIPVLSQIRFSHALGKLSKNGHEVPSLNLLPVISFYNPYNSKLQTNTDLGIEWSLNPKITLTFTLTDADTGETSTEIVEFYQAELYQQNNYGRFSVKFSEDNIQPGATLHFAFNGDRETVDGKNDQGQDAPESNRMTHKWSAVGALAFPLNSKNSAGEVISLGGPRIADVSGAVSIEEAKESLSEDQIQDYGYIRDDRWGISIEEREILDRALAEDAQVSINIDYEEFGYIAFFFNSYNKDQTLLKIQDLWRPGSGDQPDGYSNAYASFTAATFQDSFETIGIALRTSDPINGAYQTDAIRNLIDTNIRAVHSKIEWDGDNGAADYTSLFYTGAFGSNQAEPEAFTDSNSKKLGFWGNSVNSAEGQTNVILFDRPRQPLLSLGQLQHANMGRYHFDPSYIVGNSYASLRVPLTDTYVNNFGGTSGLTNFDLSYLVNDRLWDGFYFSSVEIPYDEEEMAELKAELESGEKTLSDLTMNPRIEFIVSDLSDADLYEEFLSVGEEEESAAYASYIPATQMWVNGAFNVNSTSVEAWKALISGASEIRIPIYQPTGSNSIVTETDTVISRFSRPYNRGYQRDEVDSETEFWKGYRRLNKTEVASLAEAIVEQVKNRGPFNSLASFVNRRLENSEYGKKGALQAALDSGVDGSDALNELSSTLAGETVEGFDQMTSLLSENLSESDSTNIAFPGYVLQGDLLQQIGPLLTVRSDTFTIRSYGDVVDPMTQTIVARAWCEAKVQRVPDPVASNDVDVDDIRELVRPSSSLGRNFRIVSFSWLNEDEL